MEKIKKKLYFNEFNLLMGSGGVVYLPLVSGILSAYIKTSKKISENIEVQKFIFKPDTVGNIMKKYNSPDIATFSIAMWNEQLSLAVAKEIKKTYPNCLIVFGGAHCPHEPTNYMVKHKFIDVCVRAEGEEAFFELCEKIAENNFEFEGIPNLAYRSNNNIIINTNNPVYSKNLDIYPSPYLSGEYDYLLKEGHSYQTIIETNRGCPFLCTFCYWGRGGTTLKYRFKSLDTIYKELDYFSEKKIEYVFNADSNFGMHKRDYDIALKLVENKTRSGYPEKFRTCWGKNTSKRIFKISSLMHYYELDKGMTLARQSNSKEVLKNIKRDNIKLEAYSILQKKFNLINVPVYAEMILGLPGESYTSWKDGIDELLESGLNNQLYVYQAEVYPNTELGNKDYQKKFGIVTKRTQLNEIHCSPRDQKWLKEFQEIVIQTNAMSINDWRKMTTYSILTMLLHSMKIGFFVLAYLHYQHKIKYSTLLEIIINSKTPFISELIELYNSYTGGLLQGKGRGILLKKYSDVYLEPEEVSFFKVIENLDIFYSELYGVFKKLINKTFHNELSEIIRFQKIHIPIYKRKGESVIHHFKSDIPFFAYNIARNKIGSISSLPRTIIIYTDGFKSRHEFAKKKLIWSRKSGTILNSSDLSLEIEEASKKTFNIENFDKEKTFKISLFDKSREKFESFSVI